MCEAIVNMAAADCRLGSRGWVGYGTPTLLQDSRLSLDACALASLHFGVEQRDEMFQCGLQG
jgi:hypothetical protein